LEYSSETVEVGINISVTEDCTFDD